MVFTEPFFLLVFLPLVLLGHWLAGPRLRNYLLLAASLFFYAWGEPVYVALLVVSVALNTLAGRAIAARLPATTPGDPASTTGDAGDSPSLDRARARIVGVGVAANLALLASCKYLALISDTLGLGWQTPALPIGVSFFTFQAISYLVDLHRRQAGPAGHVLDPGLYIVMFPQLVAGPIVRYADIARELAARSMSVADVAWGLRRFTLGLAKKLAVADTLAVPADTVFAMPLAQLDAASAAIGATAFFFQIYFDFSGYSDMAIGLGRMFGFHYRENFEHPYVARSMREFWRRWHISLSTWFRDYLYIPLGGDRLGTVRTAANLWVVFLLCGLWHGAAWTFVGWGAWHGAFLSLERVLDDRRTSRANAALPAALSGLLGHAYTLAVVWLGWILFRADSFAHALGVAGALLRVPADAFASTAALVDPAVALAFAAAALWSTSAPRRAVERAWNAAGGGLSPALVGSAELVWMATLMLGCAALVAGSSYEPFIYFRF